MFLSGGRRVGGNRTAEREAGLRAGGSCPLAGLGQPLLARPAGRADVGAGRWVRGERLGPWSPPVRKNGYLGRKV